MKEDQNVINRRTTLGRLGVIAGATLLPQINANPVNQKPRLTTMGLVMYDYNLRRRWLHSQNQNYDLFRPLTFLKHCHAQGAGGMQASLGVLMLEEIRKLRTFAEEHDLFIDAIIKPPKNKNDLGRFEAEVKTAREVNVQAARTTIIPGRRYERFKTLAEFRQFEKRGREMLERAAPIVKKHRLPFAVENHKDQRMEERLALFKHLDSEYIGACLDTGNSFALIDGAYEPIEALAPYTFSVHLKDQALKDYKDGFLLGDTPLGQGSFDLKRMVQIIKKSKPKIKFSLELITRDPLKVPCLTREFYSTMPTVSARELAKTLRFVRRNSVEKLQRVSHLSLEKQVQLEDSNVKQSIKYAGKELCLS